MAATPISKVNVEALVDKMLANVDINIRLLPDSIERKIYTNVITGIMATVDEVLSTVTLNIAGKKLKLDLVADSDGDSEAVGDDLLGRLLGSISLEVAGHTLKVAETDVGADIV